MYWSSSASASSYSAMNAGSSNSGCQLMGLSKRAIGLR